MGFYWTVGVAESDQSVSRGCCLALASRFFEMSTQLDLDCYVIKLNESTSTWLQKGEEKRI